MKIIDLTEQYQETYCKCLEDWSPELLEAGDYKKHWLEDKKLQGLRVKLAQNDQAQIVGMIQYLPSENAPVKATGLYYILCIWVHGYKQGVGNYQNQGVGKLLLKSAEEDAKNLGAKGMIAWGITLPFFLRSQWFKKNGYVRADREGMLELVWKPFETNTPAPRLLRQVKKPPVQKDRVTVTCFRNGWCPAQTLACERMKRAVKEHAEKVDLIEIDTNDPSQLQEWGISDAIFVDDQQVVTGPPPSYQKLLHILAKKVRRLPH